MSFFSNLQFIAWFTAVGALILGIYIWLLNPQQRTNLTIGFVLILFAINAYGVGLLLGATNAQEGQLGGYLTACLQPMIMPALLLVSLFLIKPEWTRGRWRWVLWLLCVQITLPATFTIVDVIFKTQLWHAEFDPNIYTGGYVSELDLLNGFVGRLFFFISIITTIVTILLLLFIALRDKKLPVQYRRLAWILFGAQLTGTIITALLQNALPGGLAPLLTVIVFVFPYTYVSFQKVTPEMNLPKGKLQPRLTALTLGITLPLTIAVAALVSESSGKIIKQNALERLQIVNGSLKGRAEAWLKYNAEALSQLALLPDIIGMDPIKQRPALKAMASAHPSMYLVSTTNLDGLNVARSDDLSPQDYSDRQWFKQAKAGIPLSYQVLQGKTSGQPALVISAPIRNDSGTIVGVVMFASELTVFTSEVEVTTIGNTGYTYIVDALNQVVAHPNPSFFLRDFSQVTPIVALRKGEAMQVEEEYKGEDGKQWLAYAATLTNNWIVVVQQPKNEVLSSIQKVRQFSLVVILVGAVQLLVLIWLAIRQAIQPINNLTGMATAIASGNLTRLAPVESDDEIGSLARAFNVMTAQLRATLEGLEKQVAERTLDLELRSSYLQASADVSRVIASILDPSRLSQQVVELIRERFGLYYVGLFQVDKSREWAVLKAGTGTAGQAMLSHGYRIHAGSGMIGWSIVNAQPRIALDVGGDPIRLATPDLLETRSEAALPLRSRGQVIGALTIQSAIPGTFNKDNIAVLQILADQVAIALDNAQLFTESQETLQIMQKAYGEMSREAWNALLRERTALAFRGSEQGITDANNIWHPEMEQAFKSGQVAQGEQPEDESSGPLAFPIKIRGNVIGVLDTRKPADNPKWTPEEVALLSTITEQIGLALESAQLYRASQFRAERERLIGKITSKMRESLDVDTVMQTAAREIYTAIGLRDITIRLGDETIIQESSTPPDHD